MNIDDLTLREVRTLAETALEQGRWQAQQQISWLSGSPYQSALWGLSLGNRPYDPAANYTPTRTRILSDDELDARYAKFTIDLEAKRLNLSA